MRGPNDHAPLLRPSLEIPIVTVWGGVLIAGILSIHFLEIKGAGVSAFYALTLSKMLGWLPMLISKQRLLKRLRQSEISRMSFEDLDAWHKAHRGRLYLGHGFEWETRHAQWAYELQGSEFLEGQGGQSHWIHNLGQSFEDLDQPLENTSGHALIIGTTGAGKTRFFDLMITQAVIRGETIIILDPKGDPELMENARNAALAKRRLHQFKVFHPGRPEISVRLDPLGSFNRPSELAARIAGAMPGASINDPFRAFGQRAIDQIIQGFLYTESRPRLLEIRRVIESGTDALLFQALERYLSLTYGPAWKLRLQGSVSTKVGLSHLPVMIRHYQEHASEGHRENAIDGLIALYGHDRVHFSKMVSSLLPVLNVLTTGPLESLISPNPFDLDDPREMTDLAGIIERGEIIYVGLDALSDGPAASMLASILLSDLAAIAGDRYNHATTLMPVQIFIDEAAEAVNDASIQLLNKGRGAGFRLTLATQTLSDFTARLGNEAKAFQILGNVNTVIAFRVTDAMTQSYVTGNLPRISRKKIARSHASSMASIDPFEITGSRSQQIVEEDMARFPQQLLGQLPNLHFLGKLAGGRIIKGRIPVLVNDRVE